MTGGELNSLVIKLGMDASGVKKGVDVAKGAVSGLEKDVGGKLGGLRGKLDEMKAGGGIGGALMGGAALGVGLGAISAIGGAVSGVLDTVGKGIELSSNKAEAASKANVLFGDSYGIIEDASKSAASTVALSSGKYLELAGNLGNLITNFGITGDAAANMSKDMVGLAADIGSFSNADPSAVVEAMGAAMRGESEPIRRFGVMLDDATIRSKAVALGLASSTKEVDKNARAQATWALIQEQSSKAQGDLARTATGHANAQRIAAAKTEEAMTKLGDKLLPLADKLLPILADATMSVIDAFTGVADVVGPILGPALDLVGKGFGFLVDTGKKVADFLVPVLKPALEVVGGAFSLFGKAVAGAFDIVQKGFDTLSGLIDKGISAVVEPFRALFDILSHVPGEVGKAFGSLRDKVDALQGTKGALDSVAGAALGAAAAAGHAVPAMTSALLALDTGARSVAGSWAGAATSVATSGGSLNASLTALGAAANAALDSATWYERGKNLTGSIGKGMQEGATVVLGAFDTLRTILKDGFSPATLAKELREHGKKYMDTFVEGMHSKVIGAQQAAEDAGLAAITALSKAGFGGVNGSKNLRQIGQYYDELLAAGLTSSQIDVALKAAGVSDAAITAIHKKYPKFGEAGLASGDKLGGGLTSSVPDVRVAANDLANAAMGPLGVVWQNKFTDFGDHAMGNLIGAIGGHLVQARQVSLSIAKGLSSHLAFSKPPPGPLNAVRTWLPHMIDNLVKSGQAHIGKLAAVGNDMASALAPALSPSPMGGSMGLSLDRTFRIEVSLRDVQPGVDERALGQGIGDVIGTLTGALRREFRT